MKTASIPSLRVAPDLRKAAESLLQEGETISSFVEQSLRANIARRKLQQEFLARGIASRDEAKRTGKYYPAEDVLAELDGLLAKAKNKAGRAG